MARGVAQIAAHSDDPPLNEAVISHDRAGHMRGAGSRYSLAPPAETSGRIAAGLVPVAFIGKPCDFASAIKAGNSDPALAKNLPLTIAIFCAGAPNLVATDRLLDRLGVPKDATLTDLRYRGNGWPGLMRDRFRNTDGTEHLSRGIPYGEGWGAILQAEGRWRCSICTDHTGSFADISVGDPWHNPPAGNTNAGRSLIIARTPESLRLVNAAWAARVLVARQPPREIIGQAQPNLVATQGAVWGRKLAMRAFDMAVPRDRGRSLFCRLAGAASSRQAWLGR